MNGQNRVMVFKVLLAGLCLFLCAVSVRGDIPHADDPDVYTEKLYRLDLLDYYKKTMSQAYLEVGHRDPKWDDLVVELLDAQAVRFTNYKAYSKAEVPSVTSKKRRYEIARRLKKLECSDPLVGYTILLDNSKDDPRYLDDARKHYLSMLESDYPVYRKIRFALKMVNILTDRGEEQEAAKIVDVWIDLMCQAVADSDMSLEEQNYLFQVFKYEITRKRLARWKSVCDRIDVEKPVNPWLTGAIVGAYHLTAAWEAGGASVGDTVADEGRAGFVEHLRIARGHLLKAWEVAPQFPAIPDMMIEVSMGLGDGEDRLWFERAVQGQFDYYPAYYAYRLSLRPRWGGSVDQMYDFGVECLETGRFDTRIPTVFYHVMIGDMVKERGDYEHFKRLGAYDHFITYFDGEKNLPDADSSARWWDSMKAATAWRAGRYQDAVDWINLLGDDLRTKAFVKFGGDRVLAPGECLAKTRREFEPEMNRARRHLAAKEYLKASDAYEAALVHMVPDDPAWAYLRQLSIAWQRRQQEVDGEWIDLLNQPDLWGWKNHRGKWSADERGRITGESVNGGMYLESRYNLGYRMELRGTISFLSDPDQENYNAGILLAFRVKESSRYYRNVLLYRDKQSVLASRNFAYDQDEYPAKVRDTNTFLLQMWDYQVRLVLNDEVIYEGRKMAYDMPEKTHSFALGGWHKAKGLAFRYDELKARRLMQRPVWVADPDEPDKQAATDY